MCHFDQEVPDWYGIPPNNFEFDVCDLIVFAYNVLDYKVLSNFKMSYGCVMRIPSSTYRDPFAENNHSIDISDAATGGRAQGIDHVHLSKI